MYFSYRTYLLSLLYILAVALKSFGFQNDNGPNTFCIESQILDETVELVVYDTDKSKRVKQIIYITDGLKVLHSGVLEIIKSLSASRKIPKAKYVFVSTIDPISKEDKRNEYFLCNSKYVSFFEKELIPYIEGTDQKEIRPKDRSLVGISFGGLNGAFFSARTPLFKNFALLSPITYPCNAVISDISFSKNQDLRVMLTSGKNDAEEYLKPLAQIYRSKDYHVKTLFTEGLHDFNNWNGQLEVVLNFLTKSSASIH